MSEFKQALQRLNEYATMTAITHDLEPDKAKAITDEFYASLNTIRRALKQADEIKRGESVVVPAEPTEEQWSNKLVRQIIAFSRMSTSHTWGALWGHLTNCGIEIPQWMQAQRDRYPDQMGDVHLAKGDVAVLVYAAMLASRPTTKAGE